MTISNPSLTQISQALAEMLPKLKPLSVPTGMISAFHTVPEGWLQCNGAAVSRTTYAALFAVIGTKYGSGDGSTTFNLPNLHHKFIEGTNTTSEVGQSVSAGLPNVIGLDGHAGNDLSVVLKAHVLNAVQSRLHDVVYIRLRDLLNPAADCHLLFLLRP